MLELSVFLYKVNKPVGDLLNTLLFYSYEIKNLANFLPFLPALPVLSLQGQALDPFASDVRS